MWRRGVLVAESNKPAKEPDGIRAWVMGWVQKRAGAGVPSADRITLLRDADGDGKAEVSEIFTTGLRQPFGIAFYPPGPNPKYIYVANTGDIVRLPYKNGDLKVTGTAESVASLSAGGRLQGGGH